MADEFRTPQSANEAILQNILGADNVLREPQSVIEELLIQISEMDGGGDVLVPYLNGTITEIKAGDLRGVGTIGFGAFAGLENLENVQIPKSVTQISDRAFYRCEKLRDISLHDGITRIGSSAFNRCLLLDSFVFPKEIKTVNDYVLDNCSNIKDIEMKENVTAILEGAFMRCASLETVICRAETPPRLRNRVFNNTNDTFKIYVPSQSVETYKAANGWQTYADRIFAITE